MMKSVRGLPRVREALRKSDQDQPEVDATFRLPRVYRYLGLGMLLGFLAWAALDLYMVRTDPNIPHRVAFAVPALGVPLAMAGLSAWLLLLP